MNKAFIFDMDGVIIDTENEWTLTEAQFMNKLIEKEVLDAVGSPVGLSIKEFVKRARALGSKVTEKEYETELDRFSPEVYSKARVTPGIENLASFLINYGFKLALVSSSGLNRINLVLPRISFGDKFSTIISLHERPDLQHKPHPDGYIEAMNLLNTNPESTIILEDSNPGIRAARDSGAFTIAYSGNLVKGYVQTEKPDVFAETMTDVMDIVESRV